MKSELFKHHAWLVQTLVISGGLTLVEINERWRNTEMSGGLDLPRSTFFRWKRDIYKTTGILIECRQGSYTYFISNYKDLNFDSVKIWMFQVMSLSNYLLGNLGLQNRIIFGKLTFATGVMDNLGRAMDKDQLVDIAYEYLDNRIIVAPYYIKTFIQSAFLLGKLEDGGFKWFDLGKVKEMRITETRFQMDYDPEIFAREMLNLS